jgi:hypothetical protein
MSNPKKKFQQIIPDQEEETIDPYTGEETTPAEDAYRVSELVPYDSGEHQGEDFLLEEETPLDKVAADAEANATAQRMGCYTDDKEIEDVFEERQKLDSGGRQKLENKLDQYHAQSPELTADDVDAAWEDSIVSGDESVGGMAPTPDQDVVDEIGGALGLTYEDDEPLGGEEKILERDRHRLEPDEDGENSA